MTSVTLIPQSLDRKAERKKDFQEQLGWPTESKRALLCIPTGVSDSLGGALLKELLPGLLQMPMQIVVLGKGPASYGTYLSQLAEAFPLRLGIIPHQEHSVASMLAAADMSLFLTDPANVPELRKCLENGAVPVSLQTNALKNYDPNQESGTAFLFEKPTVWHAFAAVIRALETFRFPYDWKTIQKEGMEA